MTLTQKEAEYRYDCIEQQSIIYNFHLNLYPTYYTGLSEIQFKLTKLCNNLFIDCTTKKINKFIVNGNSVEGYRHEESHLYLDQKYLKIGTNIIYVQYSNVHNTDERGIMSFVDVDEKQYLYTQFQSYFAHRVFALFDQPDLKAPMNLSITCPSSWTKVLSNEHPLLNEEFKQKKYIQSTTTFDKDTLTNYMKECSGKQTRMAIFPPTKFLPSYIYCVIAGPFEQIQLKQRYNNIPMSLYCSATYYPYVLKMAPYLFQTTVESMRFFQKFFGVPYSFNKYDQVFVHEMEMCAMENAGMVTYHDAEYIWKDQVTLEKALDLADTMVHQLAHHWFGNLTTMKWWDDLWLNESFAQFIAYYALEVIQKDLKIVKFQSSMAQFLNKKSQRGYVCDKSLITHPIRGVVQNTTVAESIFDGITYVKGASTLKQLLFLMGDQNFSAALKNYFTKFAFKNATLNDFIDTLQQKFDNQYGLTLHEWKNVWLQTCSLNQLQPVFWNSYPNGNQNQKILTIHQRPYTSQYPLLRPHKIKIALFKQDCSYDVIQIFIPAKELISIPIDPALANEYKAILLNYEDHAFAKIIIDTTSQQFFIKNLLKIKDILTRTHVWRSFYDMVMDAVIPSTKYIELFIANIGQETSDSIVERNYQSALNCIRLYTPAKYRQQLLTRLFYFTLNLIQKTNKTELNRLITLRHSICKLAQSQLAIRLLFKWYEGKYQPLTEYNLSTTNQWDIVFKVLNLKTMDIKQKLQLLSRQQKKDNSQSANLQKLKCSVVLCSDQQFDKYYESLLDPNNSMTINTKKFLMEGLNSSYNQARIQKYKEKYYENIQKSASILQPEHLRVFMLYMQPSDEKLENVITKLKGIKLEGQKLEKVNFKLLKKIDFLQKQRKGQETFMKNL